MLFSEHTLCLGGAGLTKSGMFHLSLDGGMTVSVKIVKRQILPISNHCPLLVEPLTLPRPRSRPRQSYHPDRFYHQGALDEKKEGARGVPTAGLPTRALLPSSDF